MKEFLDPFLPTALMCLIAVWTPSIAWAHCDTLSGPVIKDAKLAVQKNDVTPVLKWINEEDEKEIRPLFQKTLAVRTKSEDAKNLADRYFFETLVRVHRAGEGVPYTGLKAMKSLEPGIEMADESIEKGSAAGVLQNINKLIDAGIQTRFQKVIETKKHASDSVEGKGIRGSLCRLSAFCRKY